MTTRFEPVFSLNLTIARDLLRIEAARQEAVHLPVSPRVLAGLRETAKLYTTHYSTMIEGNRLVPEQIKKVITLEGHFPGRERDERAVKGYYAALDWLEAQVKRNEPITEQCIQTLHALVMGGGQARVEPTMYRDGQNVIRDGSTGALVYMPPEAKDVPLLMKNLVDWIHQQRDVPCPLVAAISHYQFATIHPYYDGNGRTARLLTTLILHLGGHDLKGLYSLEEYYARDLAAYYQAISVGLSHNYYLGRAESDITGWISYFIAGMAEAFERVVSQMRASSRRGEADESGALRALDQRQRKALVVLRQYEMVMTSQIAKLFGLKPSASAALCKKWVDEGFLEVADPSNKGRKYRLASKYESLLGL